MSAPQDLFTPFGEHYIAVNEAGQLRSKPPLRQPDLPYSESYRRAIDAGIANGHLVFFIHGGLNDQARVIRRVQFYDEVYGGEDWHLIHLAWDTGYGTALDDIFRQFSRWDSWLNLKRLLGFLLIWNWFGSRRGRRQSASYFGDIMWRSQYETARDALKKPGSNSPPRDHGFYRAFEYLNQQLQGHPETKISIIGHSAGSLVGNYLLRLFATDFPNLRDRVYRYILLAPACRQTQFRAALSGVAPAKPAVVMNLTPQIEATDAVGVPGMVVVYEKSLLWAVHDLFESGWQEKDLDRFAIPHQAELPVDHPINRTLLGIEEQMAALEASPEGSPDPSRDRPVHRVQTGQVVAIGDLAERVWTASGSHDVFDEDATTMTSVKMLLG